MSEKKPFRLIYEAEWNDIPCSDYPLTPETWVAESIRPLVNTQIDTLFYNLCSSDGFACELESGQILMDNFEKLGDAWVWRYRENTKNLVAHDANPPKLAVEYGHRLGLKVLPVVRMNDPHDQFFRYEVSAFKQENPHLLIGAKTGYVDWEKGFKGHPDKMSMDSFTWGLFDFVHREVREHKLAIIEEFATRWENDGISLDFERDPYLFAEQGKSENAELMTGLIREVRGILDRASGKRGRKQYLHVRVLPDVRESYRRGMDVEKWIEEGLVDAVSPGCGYMTFSLDLREWKALVEEKDCWIYPCNNHWKTPEVTRAWAKHMYRQGADGLYLFNWGHLLHGFDRHTQPSSEGSILGTVFYDDLHLRYYDSYRELGNPQAIAYGDSAYALESVPHEVVEGQGGAHTREYRAIGAIELPIELSVGRHTCRLPFADDLESASGLGYRPVVSLRLKVENYTDPDELDVSINGSGLDPGTRTARAAFIMNNDTWITYRVESRFLRIGLNQLSIDVRALNPQMSVTPVLRNVELSVKY